jgi:hypothetical protein
LTKWLVAMCLPVSAARDPRLAEVQAIGSAKSSSHPTKIPFNRVVPNGSNS